MGRTTNNISKMSPEHELKKTIKRENNKISAAKYRKKVMNKTKGLEKLASTLEKQNAQLKAEITRLSYEVDKLRLLVKGRMLHDPSRPVAKKTSTRQLVADTLSNQQPNDVVTSSINKTEAFDSNPKKINSRFSTITGDPMFTQSNDHSDKDVGNLKLKESMWSKDNYGTKILSDAPYSTFFEPSEDDSYATEDKGYGTSSAVLVGDVSVAGKPGTHPVDGEMFFKKRIAYKRWSFLSKQVLGLSGGTTSVSSLGTHGAGQSPESEESIKYDSIGAVDLSLPKP